MDMKKARPVHGACLCCAWGMHGLSGVVDGGVEGVGPGEGVEAGGGGDGVARVDGLPLEDDGVVGGDGRWGEGREDDVFAAVVLGGGDAVDVRNVDGG